MATYNGEQYIMEQLDSLVGQSANNWHLYIHDDGSTDNTPTIISQFAKQHPNVTVLEYESQKGAKENFMSLLQRVEANYYMFADQDDVWKEKKVEISWREMEQKESQHPEKAIIVYSDLCVTDDKLNVTHPSFWELSDIQPKAITKFCHLAALTPVTGCTMMFNKQAKDTIVYPVFHTSLHDAWITACVLKKGGLIHAIPQQLTYYRQHSNNCVGAIDFSHITLSYRFHHFKEMVCLNKRHYQMLQSLGYGSIFKYLFYKLLYKKQKNQVQR